MDAAQLMRKTLPLTLLAMCACGTSKTSATPGSTVVRMADGATGCPAGGEVLSYGVDKNGNGTLDDAEVAGSFNVCKGRLGTTTQVSDIAPGEGCAAGGKLVKTGVDANGNGMLDASEIATQTPICAANGNITSVLGSVQVQTTDELAHYAGVETISGSLSVVTVAGFGDVVLPKLRSVGGSLQVSSYNNNLPLAEDAAYERIRAQRMMPFPSAAGQASFPVLASVGGYVQVSPGFTVSAPALASVGGPIYCFDPNASLAALTSVGYLFPYCGSPNIVQQITSFTQSYQATAGDVVLPNLSSVVGTSRYTDATLQFTNHDTTSLSAPKLTDLGVLYAYDNDKTTVIDLPALQRLGAVYQYGGYGIHAPTVNAPHITGALGFVYLNNHDPNFVQSLTTIGGALSVDSGAYSTLDANKLTAVGALVVTSNSSLTSFSARNLSSMPAWDPNYAPFVDDGILSSTDGFRCNGSTDPSVKACASAYFGGNTSLTSIDLGALTRLPGVLWITENQQLATLSTSLTSVGSAVPLNEPGIGPVNASVYIKQTRLASLAGLQHIASAPGQLVVSGNQQLTDLGGLTLTGSADTCPKFYANDALDYCAVKHFVTAYNSACTVGTPQDIRAKDPCGSSPCQSGTCTVDCSTVNGYTCN